MKPARKIWKIGWRAGVCAILLLWIFHFIFLTEGRQAIEAQGVDWQELPRSEQWRAAWVEGPPQLWNTLRLVHPAAFGLSLLLMAATILLGVIRWRMVLRVQGLELPFTRAGEISFIAHFFNSFLLGSTGGDLLKAYYAARETHHKKTEAVVTVFADRLIGLFSMLLFAAVMMLSNVKLMAAQPALKTVAGIILLMLAACSGLVFLAFWGGVSRKFPQLRKALRRLPKGELLERSIDSCRQFGRRPGFLLEAMALSMALNVACVLQVLVLAWGLGLDLPMQAMFLIVPAIIGISALPVTPSGLGVRENLYVLLLAAPPFLLAPTMALALSLLAYAGSLFWSIVGGAVYVTVKESEHLAEITEAEISPE